MYRSANRVMGRVQGLNLSTAPLTLLLLKQAVSIRATRRVSHFTGTLVEGNCLRRILVHSATELIHFTQDIACMDCDVGNGTSALI